MDSVLVMLLAGGRGTRLNILAAHRVKPAVPFGGIYRIIDFPLSNCMHSRLRKVGVLTQYRPLSLMSHMQDGKHWDLSGKTGLLKVLPPYQGREDFDWYQGTADAVYQNLNFLWRYRPEVVLILSGDHIYKMNYREMISSHIQSGAVLTVAALRVPWEETSRFGIIVPDSKGRIVEFQEKPKQAKSNLASMGVYVFDSKVLVKELVRTHEAGGNDFGKHVIPSMIGRHPVSVFEFRGYWRDVGTLDSYWEANMDLLDRNSGIDLRKWRVRTNLEAHPLGQLSPASISNQASIRHSLISPGCTLEGTVESSILSPGVVVERGATVRNSVIMHHSIVKSGAILDKVIVDKHCIIGAGAALGIGDNTCPNKQNPSHLSSGLTVVGKGANIPAGIKVGRNVIIHPLAESNWFPSSHIECGETVLPPASQG